jgi:hypothetical protein
MHRGDAGGQFWCDSWCPLELESMLPEVLINTVSPERDEMSEFPESTLGHSTAIVGIGGGRNCSRWRDILAIPRSGEFPDRWINFSMRTDHRQSAPGRMDSSPQMFRYCVFGAHVHPPWAERVRGALQFVQTHPDAIPHIGLIPAETADSSSTPRFALNSLESSETVSTATSSSTGSASTSDPMSGRNSPRSVPRWRGASGIG